MDFIAPKQKTPKRFVVVNAVMLRDLRLNRSWSQTELARRAGYSARLIRKAESGGSLNFETIEDLATTLSTKEAKVHAEQLIFDPKEIVQQLLDAYNAHGSKCVDMLQHYLANEVQLNCSADIEIVPYAGSWQGMSGIKKFFETFHRLYERHVQSQQATYLVGDSCVSARFIEVLSYQGHELPPHRVCWHCEFQHGKIVHIEYEFDQYQASKNLLETIEHMHQKTKP